MEGVWKVYGEGSSKGDVRGAPARGAGDVKGEGRYMGWVYGDRCRRGIGEEEGRYMASPRGETEKGFF